MSKRKNTTKQRQAAHKARKRERAHGRRARRELERLYRDTPEYRHAARMRTIRTMLWRAGPSLFVAAWAVYFWWLR